MVGGAAAAGAEFEEGENVENTGMIMMMMTGMMMKLN